MRGHLLPAARGARGLGEHPGRLDRRPLPRALADLLLRARRGDPGLHRLRRPDAAQPLQPGRAGHAGRGRGQLRAELSTCSTAASPTTPTPGSSAADGVWTRLHRRTATRRATSRRSCSSATRERAEEVAGHRLSAARRPLGRLLGWRRRGPVLTRSQGPRLLRPLRRGGPEHAARPRSCSRDMLQRWPDDGGLVARHPQGRAGGRPDHPRHHPAAQHDLRHADRPRGHLRPRHPDGRHRRLHRGGRGLHGPLPDRGADGPGAGADRGPGQVAASSSTGCFSTCAASRTSTTTGSRSTASRTTATGSTATRWPRCSPNGIDPMVVIRWRDMFLRLERAIDATETVRLDPRGHRHQERVSDTTSSWSSSSRRRSPSTSPTASTTPPTSSRPRSRPRAMPPRVAVAYRRAAQLRRRLHLARGRGDRRQGRRRRRRDHADGRLRRPDRGDRLEPGHLVLRASLELLARADRRRRRLGVRGRRRRTRCSATGWSARS